MADPPDKSAPEAPEPQTGPRIGVDEWVARADERTIFQTQGYGSSGPVYNSGYETAYGDSGVIGDVGHPGADVPGPREHFARGLDDAHARGGSPLSAGRLGALDSGHGLHQASPQR